MDIRRVFINDQFKYIDYKTRKRIKDKQTLKRIRNMRIPPAYMKVKITKKKDDKVQAVGFDLKGRKQYIYNNDFILEQQEMKFQELIQFGKKIKRIRKDYRKTLESRLPYHNKKKIISMILFLLDVCKFRVGTEEYKKIYKTYGATTINKDHILFRDGEVEISFIGKKSVKNTSVIKNENVIKLLGELCRRNRHGEYIFYYKDDKTGEINNITAQQITGHLKKYHNDFSPKMFRTWNGNSVLLKHLISRGEPESMKDIKRNLLDGLKKTAEELHNTIAVSKKSYCNSEIYTTYLNENDKFFEFIENNKKDNGESKGTDRLLTLFLIKYYKK